MEIEILQKSSFWKNSKVLKRSDCSMEKAQDFGKARNASKESPD